MDLIIDGAKRENALFKSIVQGYYMETNMMDTLKIHCGNVAEYFLTLKLPIPYSRLKVCIFNSTGLIHKMQ
jgi:hypothetical protein